MDTTSQAPPETKTQPTIKERRTQLGMTIRGAAKRAGVTHPTLMRIEEEAETGADMATIKSSHSSRRKVLEMLDREERERDEFGIRAHNAVAKVVSDLEDLVDTGAISPAGMVLSLAAALEHYRPAIEKRDAHAVKEANMYSESVLRGRIQGRAERN